MLNIVGFMTSFVISLGLGLAALYTQLRKRITQLINEFNNDCRGAPGFARVC